MYNKYTASNKSLDITLEMWYLLHVVLIKLHDFQMTGQLQQSVNELFKKILTLAYNKRFREKWRLEFLVNIIDLYAYQLKNTKEK